MYRLLLMLHGYWKHLLAALAMLVGLVLVNMAVPATIAILFNEVFPDRLWSLLWMLLVAMLGVYMCRNLLYFGSKYTAVYVGEQTAFTVRRQLFERLQSQSLQFYRKRNPGELTSRVMNDSFVIQTFIQEDLLKLVQAGFMFVGLLIVLFVVNWQLALASTIVLPLHLYVFYKFRRPIKQSSRFAQQQLANVQGSLIEKFLGMEVVKGFAAEDRENAAFVRAIDSSRQSQLQSKRYHVYQKIVADTLVGIGTVTLLGFGGYQVMKGGPEAMRPGTFIAFFGYVGMLYPTVIELMSGFAKLTRTGASLERVFEMLDATGIEQATVNPIVKPIQGDLTFRNVSYRYKRDDAPLLKHLNIEVRAGKVCALMGPSGSGKTTVLSLVPRFADPDEGQILLDGVDASRYNLKHLRSSVAMAFQDTFLFNTSIVENIRYAKPDAEMSEIVKVAKITGADAFIERLPQGYKTIIGEGGVTLSRGEKQRIVLTRALLRKPRILILDEATASIDYASEAQIIPQVIRYMKGRTVLIATHRADLLRHVDQVVMLDQGEVAYQGSPRRVPGVMAKQMGLQPERRAALAGTQMGATAYGTAFGTISGTTMMPANGSGPSSQTTMVPAIKDKNSDKSGASGSDDTGDHGKSGGTGMSIHLNAFAGALLLALGLLAGPAMAQEEEPAEAEAAPAAPAPAEEAAGRDFSRGAFMAMTGLNMTELEEVMEVVSLQLQTQHGYMPALEDEAARLADPPVRLRHVETLIREEDDGVYLLQLGYQMFRSQPPHVWINGRRFEGETGHANEDMAAALALLQGGRQTLDEQYATLQVSDLKSHTITLSYIEADRCMAILKSLGYEGIEFPAGSPGVGESQIIEPNKPVDMSKLPIVVAMPGPEQTTLVGGEAAMTTNNQFGLGVVPSVAANLPNQTSSAPMMQLMVLYHPSQPEQLSKLKQRIENEIDLPARQILMEAMVLEISERGLQELGVDWELSSPIGNLQTLQLGRLPDGLTSDTSTLDVGLDNIFGHFQTRIRALVRDDQAEILSRPSVLTLDNRQALIRVGEEIPIATSVKGVRTGDTVAFDFKYLPTGILLNVRPRVSADAEEVSIQVDGIVSSQVPGQDLVVRGDDGRELARAPRISTRRVQSYLRVHNNTPFIIGGLVARDKTQIEEKVPILGDLPLVGGLFRNRRDETLRSEVIIVLTPFVLPEDRVVARSLPKDEDAFDSFDNRLFRDGYRIRTEDVFDLAFIDQNPYLREMRTLAAEEMARDYQLARGPAFGEFAEDRVPGERLLVYRQIYEVINRREIDEQVQLGRVILFERDDTAAGFSVAFLEPYLRQLGDLSEEDMEDLDEDERTSKLFESLQKQGKALAITYTRKPNEGVAGTLQQPVPEISLVDSADRLEWSEKLWAMNQRDDQGRERATILLQGPDDLVRLRRAIVLKRAVPLNTEAQTLSLKNFSVGRLLLMPSINEQTVHLIDGETAMYFFATEHYYPAFAKELTEGVARLRQALERRNVPLPTERSVVPARPQLPGE